MTKNSGLLLPIFHNQSTIDQYALKQFLDERVKKYNCLDFIELDPVNIPHRFTKRQDIEIAGFFAAILAWGNRQTIINSSARLMNHMGMEPHKFILDHSEEDLKELAHFKHRTFQPPDLHYFIHFLKKHYLENDSLETAFSFGAGSIKERLINFHKYFFDSDEFLPRTRKHIATPERGSACKRINMYLRWMVRKDSEGVDFGLWKSIPMSDLVCPFDVHVANISRQLKLVQRKQNDWQAAVELTENLRKFDRNDPVKYDFALFGLGIETKSIMKL